MLLSEEKRQLDGISEIPYGIRRALEELLSVISGQWENGMLPHIIYSDRETSYRPSFEQWNIPKEMVDDNNQRTSGITQPPNAAIALWKILSKNKSESIIPIAERIFAALQKYHDFLLNKRDPYHIGLVAIFHPWESGTDNSPYFDALLEKSRKELEEQGYGTVIEGRADTYYVSKDYRPSDNAYDAYGRLIGYFAEHNYDQKFIYDNSPFVVIDVMFNTILAESLSSMSRIARILSEHYGDNDNQKCKLYEHIERHSHDASETVRKAIREELYDSDSGIFYPLDVRNNQHIEIPTVHSLLPLFGKCATEDQAASLLRALQDDKNFHAKNGCGVPSASLSLRNFDNLRYWKGPSWPVTNWLIIRGLEEYGGEFSSYAKALKDKNLAMNLENMFAEHDYERIIKLASSVLEHNTLSFGDGMHYTQPSTEQYPHLWLWDACFSAIGWCNVAEKTNPSLWSQIIERRNALVLEQSVEHKSADFHTIRKKLGGEFQVPFFDEYYATLNKDGYEAGFPLGAPFMSWDAAFVLDLIRN